MLSLSTRLTSLAAVVTLLGVTSCGGNQTSTTPTSPQADGASPAANTEANPNLSGNVTVDGSSTVFPIAEAMAEEFQKANPKVRVTVGVSGTGGGFKKFCRGETDISNASRPITKEEIKICEQNKIQYIELPVSYDGLSVVVNPKNDFVECLTLQQLKTMWEPAAQGKISNWSQISPDFPNRPLALYGPGTDSGTYDYFTENIVGEEGSSRGDYTASEDDNTLVQGVSSNANALGFFGYAYYEENKDKLKLVGIDGGKGCVEPSPETISEGTYAPLSRPEFIYVKQEAAKRPEVAAFVNFQLAEENQELISQVGYVPLPDDTLKIVQNRFENQKTGTVFAGEEPNVSLKELLQKEQS